MRSRAFILVILILLVVALGVILWVANNSGNNLLANLRSDGGAAVESADEAGTEKDAQPAATPTPAVRFEEVVVAKTDLPIGTTLTLELLDVEQRPDTNIAFQAADIHVTDPEELVGEIIKVAVGEGQEILRPMLAVNPTDLSSLGSDLALYVDQGRVAVAVPIDRYSGVAFAMRPGDLVDVLMTLDLVELDETFHTQLPNQTARLDETGLTEGRPFLLPSQLEGRLEFVEELGIVAEIAPGAAAAGTSEATDLQIPRRVTQLTVQQAQVVWVGTWQQERPSAPETAETDALGQAVVAAPTPDPVPQRSEMNPDIVILSMTTQEALSLKWALERGLDVDLVLRSPGDNNIFVTTSVSLPQLVDQGRIIVPEQGTFDAFPRADEVLPPAVPVSPPSP